MLDNRPEFASADTAAPANDFQQQRDMNAALLVSSVRQHELTEKAEQAEAALRESEERFRTLFASAPMALFVCDREAVIQQYNAIAVELWGRTPTLGVEKHCGSTKLWLPDGTWLPHAQSPVVDVLRTGIPVHNVEVFIERPDGSRMPVLVNFAAFKNVRGEIIGAVTSFIDITERKRAEAKLRESEDRFRAVADNIPQLAWMVDGDGYVGWFNQGWLDYTGTTLEDNQGAGWKRVHHPDCLEKVAEKFERHLREGKDWEDTFPLRGKDGRYRWFLSRMNAIRDQSGRVVRFFGTNTDVTDQLEMEHRIRQQAESLADLHRRKDEFLAMLSHELRNPLSPILNAVQILRLQSGNDPLQQHARTIIERQVGQLKRLIDDLLEVSRITAGRVQLRQDRIVASGIVDRGVETARPLSNSAGTS